MSVYRSILRGACRSWNLGELKRLAKRLEVPALRRRLETSAVSTYRRRILKKRNRLKQTKSLQERLAEFAEDARQEAAGIPGGQERDILLKKIRKAENASNIVAWANSPELQPPK